MVLCFIQKVCFPLATLSLHELLLEIKAENDAQSTNVQNQQEKKVNAPKKLKKKKRRTESFGQFILKYDITYKKGKLVTYLKSQKLIPERNDNPH